jgi:hypothetical protein
MATFLFHSWHLEHVGKTNMSRTHFKYVVRAVKFFWHHLGKLMRFACSGRSLVLPYISFPCTGCYDPPGFGYIRLSGFASTYQQICKFYTCAAAGYYVGVSSTRGSTSENSTRTRTVRPASSPSLRPLLNAYLLVWRLLVWPSITRSKVLFGSKGKWQKGKW